MTHQIYVRKTKRFLSKNKKKVALNVKKVSHLSFDSVEPFEELPSTKIIEGRNASVGMNAFDLFQAFTRKWFYISIVLSIDTLDYSYPGQSRQTMQNYKEC